MVNGVAQKLHLPAMCRMGMDVLIKSMETTTMSQYTVVNLAHCAKAIRSDINKSLYTMILWCLMSYDRCAVNLYGVKS